MYALSREDVPVFSERGRINLHRLASEEALRDSLRNEFMMLVSYGTDDDSDEAVHQEAAGWQ